MNGGRKKWELENRDYTTDEPQISPSQYIGQPPDEGLRAYLFDVSRGIGKEDTVMVDVRSLQNFLVKLQLLQNIQWNMHKEVDIF